MDPGNWATDIESGARFGYSLLWVLVASNCIALLLQSLCARLGVVTGMNLASACHAEFSRPLSISLWVLAELGIIACDLAEMLGSAVALNLLFDIPILAGAVLTSVDVLLLLLLQRRGMRRLEALVLVLLLTIGGCMVVEFWLAKPSGASLVGGLKPTLTGESLYAAIGLLGATVMPHNLYLHSALVSHVKKKEERRSALRKGFWSTALALNLALLVNGAILVVAAATFGKHGVVVDDIREAHRLLTPMLGTSAASVLFAVGLLCAGQSATVSGTLAGQVVMEGFLRVRIHPALRRGITRALAIIPAIAILATFGDSEVTPLLVGSQIILSLQLPFAVIPLIKLTSSRALMSDFANGSRIRLAASACAALIVLANMALVARTAVEAWHASPWLGVTLIGAGLGCIVLLGWVAMSSLASDRLVAHRLHERTAREIH
jgi:manganese transport protein